VTSLEPQASHLVEVDGDVVRVHLLGELDLAVAAEVSGWLDKALDEHPGKHLEVDLSMLEFLDSSGIRALLNAHISATARGRRFRVVGATGGVREVLEIVDVHDLLAAGNHPGGARVGESMQAIQVSQPGGPEALRPAQVPTPEPGQGQVLVDLVATGVNFIEIYQREGRYPMPLPFTPGGEGAGVVSAVGPGVTEVKPGDRVASVDLDGSYAAQALVAADRLVPVPEGIETETAAAVMLQGMTAHYLLRDVYALQAGDTILVHAAAGGMGLLLTQLATKLGARVIGTVSTETKERLAREAGAAEVIRYIEADVVKEVRRLTDGAGVAAVFDAVGKDTFDASLECLRVRGTLALYGAASGAVPPLDPMRLQHAGSVKLTRPTLRHFILDAAELRERAEAVFGWVADGTFKVRVHERYPLAEAARAHEDLKSRRTTGKLLLIP
jgi:NADPH2:quinone reductase